MAKKTAEPKLGISRVKILSDPQTKTVAFFDLYLPTKEFGDIILRNFRVVRGEKGLFISLPSRPSKVKNEAGEEVPKYFNDIRFETRKLYDYFRKELEGSILPQLESKIKKAVV